MQNELINPSAELRVHILPPNSGFPNNKNLAVLRYKNAVVVPAENPSEAIKQLFEQNGWTNTWTDGLYNYQHYHSTAHEIIVVTAGTAMVLLGGEDGNIQHLDKGDALLIPAGVAHKNVGASPDFECVGAYPQGQNFDMMYGNKEERDQAEENIKNVGMPSADPLFGNDGPLLKHWKKEDTTTELETSRQF